MSESKKAGVDRREFLKSAAAGIGATAAAAAPLAGAAEEKEKEKAKKAKTPPGDIVIERPGSDFMIDVIKTLDLEYMATNPGSSFRSLHESLVN